MGRQREERRVLGAVYVKSSLLGLSRSNILCPKINRHREPPGFSHGGVSVPKLEYFF